MDIQSAIDAPNFQILHFPSSFFPRKASPGQVEVEGRVPPRSVEELIKRGHMVRVEGDWSGGDETAIMYNAERKVFYGAASPRREKSYAMGW